MSRKGAVSQYYKRVLSLLLVLMMAMSHTGCGSLLSKADPGAYDNRTSVEKATVSKGRVGRREKKVIDYSTDRFSIGGINAFYILPGLENIPDAMAEFQVIDYTPRGEFVYYYVTPCYMDPGGLEAYKDKDGSRGTVKDRTKVDVPEGRREDYDYDAAVLMTYNPGTGEYRVLYAKAFQIDKQKEFDPATEGRPYYYLSNEGSDKDPYRTFIQERILCCKVAGQDEYLLVEQGSLTGTVFDVEGDVLKTVSFRATLNNEAGEKKNELIELREEAEDEGEHKLDDDEFRALAEGEEEVQEDTVDPNTMNVLITGAVMTERYESYLGVTYFLGGDLFKAVPAVISSTCMVYRQSLNEEDGGVPYVSTNLNSEPQKEMWMSLDGRFFKDYKELESADGYSMEGIKTGRYGNAYKDSFTPFMNVVGEDEASFLVGMPYFLQIPGKVADRDYAEKLFDAYKYSYGTDGSYSYNMPVFVRRWLNSVYDNYSDDNTADKIKWGADNYEPAKKLASGLNLEDILKNTTRNVKRGIQAVAADALTRKMNEETVSADTLEDLISYFSLLHYLPKPGEYSNDNGMNKAPAGFEGSAGEDEDEDDTDEGDGIVMRSDHVVTVVSKAEGREIFLSPVDYFPESHEDGEKRRFLVEVETNTDNIDLAKDTPGLKMLPYELSPSLNRTVYVYDTAGADNELKDIKSTAGLSEDQSKAIDELSLLMRTSPDIWEKVKLGWFISQVTGDMNDIIDTVSADAAKARDAGKISGDDYKKITDLLRDIRNDAKKRDAYEAFKKAREDAEKKHKDGELSDSEYEEIIKTIDKAEKEKLGLNDEDWEMFQKLVAESQMIADVQKALTEAGAIGKKDTLDRIEELSKKIPEEIREGTLYLCAGFRIMIQSTGNIPLSYKAVFPEGAAVDAGNGAGHETAGGSMDSHKDGVIVTSESDGDWFEGNAYMIGYRSANDMDLFDRYTYGTPVDLSSMEYRKGDEVRSIVVLMTDKGAKFLEKNPAQATSQKYSRDDLKNMMGDYNGQKLNESLGAHKKTELKNIYTPLPFDQRGNEAYESVKAEKDLPEKVTEEDFRGFLTNRMLVTSTGYTRDAENLMTDAIQEGLARISASENTSAEEQSELITVSAASVDERYTGHLSSSKNISMIAMDKALICSVTGGTKILDLNHGTVADDMQGSYFRAYQRGNSSTFSLIGFSSTDYSYLDVDLPLAKIYTLDYANGELDHAVIEAFMNMTDQYAKDYLYREYRTVLAESGDIQLKESTEAEKQESIEAGAIFDPANKSYETALSELEKKYGIERTPAEIREHIEGIRERIAAVRPTITKLYELAGAGKLAGDTATRAEGYWRNVESRMTMAKDTDSLGDILVEIRMHDTVLPSLKPEQASRYRQYKKVIDLTREHTVISANDIFGDGSASMNNAEAVQKRLRVTYRNDVMQDIINDYCEGMSKRQVSGNVADMSETEKKDAFDMYLSTLLNRVNPENFATDKERAADEFVDVMNHGKKRLTGKALDEMRERTKEELDSVDAVWKLEELVLREKIKDSSTYPEYIKWYEEYTDRVYAAESSGAALKIPVKTGDSDTSVPPLSGDERISYLRTSAAYKAVIGDLKKDPAVKAFLEGRKQTWDDYCKEVVRKAGMRVLKDDYTQPEETAE